MTCFQSIIGAGCSLPSPNEAGLNLGHDSADSLGTPSEAAIQLLTMLFPDALERIYNVIQTNGGMAKVKWRGQSENEHAGHAARHLEKHLRGEESTDPDLDHAATRLVMALQVQH